MERRVLRRSLLLAGLLCLPALTTDAMASGPGFYVRAQAGYAVPAMDEVNAEIDARHDALAPTMSNLEWDGFSGNGQYEVEFGYRFMPAFSTGLGMGYQISTRNHSADQAVTVLGAPGTLRLGETVQTRLFTAYVTPTLWLPAVPGLHLGGQLGLGWGAFSRTSDLVLEQLSGDWAALHSDEEYAQTRFIAGVFAGYDHPLTPASAIAMRVGYLSGKFDDMQGTRTALLESSTGPSSTASGQGALEDSSGNAMPVDFSGVSVTFGVVFQLPSGR